MNKKKSPAIDVVTGRHTKNAQLSVRCDLNCQKRNHFAKMCRSQGQAKKMHPVEQSDDDELFLGSVEVEQETCIKKIDSAEMDDDD